MSNVKYKTRPYKIHWTLQQIGYRLFKEGKIKFDPNKMEYVLTNNL